MTEHTAGTTALRTAARTGREAPTWRPGLGGRLLAPWRGLALLGLGVAAAVLSWLLITAMVLLVVWVGFALVPALSRGLHALAGRQLALGRRWSGIADGRSDTGGRGLIDEYEAGHQDGYGYGYGHRNGYENDARVAGAAEGRPTAFSRVLGLLKRPSTWRELAWAQVAVTAGGLLALLPFAMLAHGLFGIVLPFIWQTVVSAWDGSWYLFLPLTSQVSADWAAGLGILEILLALWTGPHILRAQARLSRSLIRTAH
ncbi:sensor domain-containing protein [Streptomyces sp. MST-110588]|uniref:sensor domain-containing protein n=1 Tax=Streptomyces sp. MST-110588 TaxID=2833628 RepID=UPI001F5C6424|nr:sensor domain-containing protein [Streptomyces sp. MST-110588]UNO41121.1 sensor domain-containing protein [Streptomyces sp. MST-110588]